MMNVHTPPSQFLIDSDEFGAERALVARCLASPDLIGDVAGRVSQQDFRHEFLGLCFKALVDLKDGGRKPSLETLASIFCDEEVEPGLSVRTFLTELLRGSLYGQFIPIDDAIEVIRDESQRRVIAEIGGDLVKASGLTTPLSEVIGDISHRLDDLAASFRQSVRHTYDGAGIADAAFAHLDSTERTSPTTGLVDLDRDLGGWPKGELSVVAGRPGMGKSAFATSALWRAAKARHGCLFFSLEMTSKQLGARLLTDIAYTHDDPIFYQDVLKRTIQARHRDRLRKARDVLAQYPLTIEEQRGLTITDIATRSRKLAAKYANDGGSLDVVFVDHMLLVRPSQRYAGNRVREVAEISDGLASLAKELNIAVVALCQLNRGVEGRDIKRPTLSDLRDSGAIEEDASTVTFIYRPAYYLEQTKAEGEAERKRLEALQAQRHNLEFIIAKNRNGRVGIVDAFVEIGANAIRNKDFGGFR